MTAGAKVVTLSAPDRIKTGTDVHEAPCDKNPTAGSAAKNSEGMRRLAPTEKIREAGRKSIPPGRFLTG